MTIANNQINMGIAYTGFNTSLTGSETSITNAMSVLASNPTEQPTQSQLLLLQYKLQVFTFFAELASSMEKKIGETFQGVVRNF
jgi:hypothetical protein